ncbi:MAG TPA: hypothetical protein VGD10_12705 [Allosphingosinicella sp.]|uniref:hypothetical protein n=1 Tax=Allosphingosinicella sp. TaxID=2823234 RepID=UPI002EDB6796
MKKFLLAASAAAMAVSMPALAKPGNGNGNGNGGGGGGNKGGGHAAHVAKPQKAERQSFKAPKAERQSFKAAKAERVQFGGGRVEKAQKRQQVRFADRPAKAERKSIARRIKAENKRIERVRENRFEDRRVNRWDDDDRIRTATFRNFNANGDCPPGLAKKNNGCLPPGQVGKTYNVGERLSSEWYQNYNVPLAYRSFYADTPDYYYRYDDNGYIYRVSRDTNLVNGLVPLLGGGFGIGQVLPAGYDIYNVPLQYRDTYYDTDDYYYRYGDNAIYQVDPQSMMIENVVALLTGDTLGIGQTLPAGYDMYNVPWEYRDQYYDTDEYNYRYADGNIYQVDPQTQIIQAIISALV